jgi:hypothetical protein
MINSLSFNVAVNIKHRDDKGGYKKRDDITLAFIPLEIELIPSQLDKGARQQDDTDIKENSGTRR